MSTLSGQVCPSTAPSRWPWAALPRPSAGAGLGPPITTEPTHLHPEVRAMLDTKDDEKRLNFNSALALSRIPSDQQRELLTQANALKTRGGHALMYQFIVRQARALREHRGVTTRSRRLSDDRVVLERTVETLYRLAVNFCGERRSTEHQTHVRSVLGLMGIIDLDQLLHKLNESLIAFQGLKALTQGRRDTLYQEQGLRIIAR